MTVHVVVQEHGPKAGLDNPGGEEMRAQLGGKDAGLPFFAFLDVDEEMLANSLRPDAGRPSAANIGYPAKPEEIEWFLAMLAKAAPEMPAAESARVGQWLRDHDK